MSSTTRFLTAAALLLLGNMALAADFNRMAGQLDVPGGLVFYGEAIESIYTDESVYWLEPGELI